MKELDCAESSNLHWARYDEPNQTLEIDFKGKDGAKVSTYSYSPFTAEEWAQFNASESHGRFFAYQIRSRTDLTVKKLWP